jgi:hypothetical protein
MIRVGGENQKWMAYPSVFDPGILIPRRSAESKAGFDGHAARTAVGCSSERAENSRITNGLKALSFTWASQRKWVDGDARAKLTCRFGKCET